MTDGAGSRKKAVVQPINFRRSDWDVPPLRNGVWGRGEGGIDLHCRFGAQRRPSKKTARMGDKAKPLASLADGFAVFNGLCTSAGRSANRAVLPLLRLFH